MLEELRDNRIRYPRTNINLNDFSRNGDTLEQMSLGRSYENYSIQSIVTGTEYIDYDI